MSDPSPTPQTPRLPARSAEADESTLGDLGRAGGGFASAAVGAGGKVWTLTVLLHPDPSRVGARAALTDLHKPRAGLPVAVSRQHPEFLGADSLLAPLLNKHVSRAPIWLSHTDQGIQVIPGERGELRVDGTPVREPRRLQEGAILELGEHVLLHLSRLPAVAPSELCWEGLVGLSAETQALRERIDLLARTTTPVLIRGESGVGKELIAAALHRRSPRAGQPWLTLNAAALPAEVAAAELFGHARGAFTGASHPRKGLFEQAHRGTLFLDEIGEVPLAVQPLLLRALDSGEIQPLGRPVTQVDVRVIGATDADLEGLSRAGRFRLPLYYRLRVGEILVPPLRDRPVDIPPLLVHLLRQHLRALGAEERLEPREGKAPWLGCRLVAQIARMPLAGNARELSYLAFEIASASATEPHARLPKHLEQMAASPTPRPSDPTLSPEQVFTALETHQWNVSRAAMALGVSKNRLVRAMKRAGTMRLAGSIDEATIRSVLEESVDLADAAALLRTSTHGLKLRLKSLGISLSSSDP